MKSIFGPLKNPRKNLEIYWDTRNPNENIFLKALKELI